MRPHPRSARHIGHLVARTVASARARPLSPREESEVAGLLDDTLAAFFWDQPVVDQRHAIDAAHTVLEHMPGNAAAARAALLHDVGKRHARLGIVGRIVATVLAMLHLPARGRLAVYLDHARLGADELAAAGAEELEVAYARHQDDERPDEISPAVWRVLKWADGESHRLSEGDQYDGGHAEPA
jgi:hypothetical protein